MLNLRTCLNARTETAPWGAASVQIQDLFVCFFEIIRELFELFEFYLILFGNLF